MLYQTRRMKECNWEIAIALPAKELRRKGPVILQNKEGILINPLLFSSL